jgi:hypothetical protein
VKDGIRCELVKLHTINKKKPTKKFVGRKRQTAEKEGRRGTSPDNRSGAEGSARCLET